MPGARVVGQFDDGPGACQHAEKPFQIRSVGMTSKSVDDTRLTADDPCKSFVKEKHSSPGALAIHVHDFVVADPAEPLRKMCSAVRDDSHRGLLRLGSRQL